MNKTSYIFTALSLAILSSCSKDKQDDVSAQATTELSEGQDATKGDEYAASAVAEISADEPISFNEHIQPILSASCYHCHGPDSGTRFPEDEPLRLDSEEGAFAVRENGKPVIIKGDPDNSYLLQLMESTDKELVMPPDPSKSVHGKVMDPKEIALVRRWIKEGAVYEDHWAYIAPEKAELPEVKQKDWARNAVDYFVLSKLEKNGLKPNEEEDKARLLRRVSFDLTGLPPTPEEIEAFVSDERDFEKVYEEKVDALLKSDAYAENFARHWLDVARYADTHGIHIDNYRSIWPYRDWVINAFRENMAFDQFTREQIAGDMFPNATTEQKVASGFHRCLPTTGEGGAIAEEYKAVYAQDRVDTTSAAWLGLTAGCAACHDHKFDAISTKENYQFTAFFRNTTMSALDGNNAIHPPNILVSSPKDKQEIAELDKKIKKSAASLEAYQKGHEAEFQAWLKQTNGRAAEKEVTLKGLVAHLPLDDKAKGVNHPGVKSSAPLSWGAGLEKDAVHFTKGTVVDLGNKGDFERDQSFSYGAWIKFPEKLNAGIITKMDTNDSFRGYDLWIENSSLAVHLINQWPQNFIKVGTRKKYRANTWLHVMVTYDGSKKPEGIKIYVDGESQPMKIIESKLTKTIKTKAPLLLGGRHTGQPFTNGYLQHFQMYDRALTAQEVLTLTGAKKGARLRALAAQDPKQVGAARDYYFDIKNVESGKLDNELVSLKKKKSAVEKRGVRTLVMKEKKNSKPTAHVLIRGDYSVKDKEVLSPGVPAALPPMTDDMPRNRLGLAMWLTDPKNPLPARVTVNRYWSYFFGVGIVETNGDFGVMGARPTHPKLLDWLAKDFVDQDWDMHQMIKNIVMSSTYRQNSTFTKKKLALDPKNKMLSRGPRYRLDAEEIRDLALSASGLLIDKVGGPPVKPYQPANVWSAVAMKESNTRNYKQDKGEKLYRRSIYTFIKRTAINPSMEILNAPSREEACVHRELTNTPLQAFVLMNDPQFVESSRQLAAKALTAKTEMNERVNFISMRLIARKMSADELAIISATLQQVQEKFAAKPEEAAKIIKVGESIAPASIDKVELAAWTVVANQIINMDETLNK